MARVDPLGLYNAKRDFARTAEPAGKIAAAKGNSFVVQKHDATRLHWDFRLEIDGVLKSWAVTRGPSPDPADKRLAVRTEDHPLDYGKFEGTIPQTEYGGGSVMLWDRGTWEPVAGKSPDDLNKGHLHFVLHGERMKGEWLLIRLKPRAKEKRENWLLRKIDDDFASGGDTLVERALTSVTTGRTMQEITEGKRAPKRSGRSKAAKPLTFVPVQLATLADRVPEGSDWLHETKYDGYRALIAIGGGKARLYTRTGLDWSDKFPHLIDAAAALGSSSALIDGEVVVLDAEGRPGFSALQQSIEAKARNSLFFAFDLLHLDGSDLRRSGNLERKERLRPLIPLDGPLRYAEHVLGSGEKLLAAMCAARLEGIVSKRADAPYYGRRSQAWIKVKCIERQEFVILGWTNSTNKMRGFGALLMGARSDGELRYVGKVGTGFDGETIAALRGKFDRIKVARPAAEIPAAARRGAHWVKPDLVAEVAYAAMTPDGILRHASFVALRGDKPADSIELEMQASAPLPQTVAISNRSRVIFPEAGITKGDLAEYYAAMAEPMLRWLAGRPLSLVRCPQGRAKACFFQKHGAENLGDAIRTVKIRGKEGKSNDYMYIDEATGLIECVQMGTIEFHGWGSRAPDIELPDRMVFDLDPDEAIGFDQVVRSAQAIKQQLSALGLVSFAMLSGGKGLHIVVPLTPQADWPDIVSFARRFAQALATAQPDRYVATMAKAKRKGRIFIDWLRNQRGSTAIMPYSVRARPGAPVAAPVAWSELGEIASGGHFSVSDREKLLRRCGSRLLSGWGQAAQVLPAI